MRDIYPERGSVSVRDVGVDGGCATCETYNLSLGTIAAGTMGQDET